jgi:hypothetical protein
MHSLTMVRSAACAAAALLAATALAGEHRFRVAPGSTSLFEAGVEAPLVGSFVGDWDPKLNPAGTRTMRGLLGGNGSTDNQTIDYTADLVAQLVADRAPTGGFWVRLPTQGDGALVRDLRFDLLAGQPENLTVTLDLVFASFRTRQPNSTFFGSSAFPPIPIANGQVTALRIEQSGEAPAVAMPLPGGGTSFMAMVPVNLVVQASVLGQPVIDQVIPAMLPVAGAVGAGPDFPGTTITFADGFKTPLPELPAFEDQPVGIPTILPPGSTANLLFSGQVNGPAGALTVGVDVNLSLTSEAVPVDITGDGIVNGADLARVLWKWGTADQACDLDQNGTVSGSDMAMVIACWGMPAK